MQSTVHPRNPNQPHHTHSLNTSTPQKTFPPPNRSVQGPLNPRRCFKCQGLGHVAADCPNRRVITLAEWDAVKEDVVEEETEESVETPEEEEEEVIAEADEGELLVLRRSLRPGRTARKYFSLTLYCAGKSVLVDY